jgi:two-component system, sensor histidine kinase and response regulator
MATASVTSLNGQTIHRGDDPHPSGGRLDGVSLLLVDDHRPSALALEAVLEPLGYRLVVADSAAAALRLLATERFTAILSDVRMPGMDGFQMLARLRAHGMAKNAAVVLFSAVSQDRESAKKAYELGAVDFFVKPYDPELLRWRIQALVALCRGGEPLPATPRRAAEAVAPAGSATAMAVAEEAERLLRSKDRFVAVLGHDLRGPLSAMKYGCSILDAASTLTEQQRSTVARLGRAVDRMSKMVADIVDFARTSRGTSFPIRPRPTRLADVLSMVVDEVRDAHPARVFELSVSQDLFGACDPDRMAQAIGNLVSNAVKHGKGAVHVSAQLRGAEVEVAVHNGGDPIPEERIPTLFDPFALKAENSEGLGLGLYIVNEIARGHRGTVQVKSSRAHGTTFTLCWPGGMPHGVEQKPSHSEAEARPTGVILEFPDPTPQP